MTLHCGKESHAPRKDTPFLGSSANSLSWYLRLYLITLQLMLVLLLPYSDRWSLHFELLDTPAVFLVVVFSFLISALILPCEQHLVAHMHYVVVHYIRISG